jgi:hypothetical protein
MLVAMNIPSLSSLKGKGTLFRGMKHTFMTALVKEVKLMCVGSDPDILSGLTDKIGFGEYLNHIVTQLDIHDRFVS